jgi:prephenate dehydrogenase
MAGVPPFERAAVLGTGLVGGSFALALRRAFPETRVIGWDLPRVAQCAVDLGAVHEAAGSAAEAVEGADLVYLALPVGATLDLLPTIAANPGREWLVTDACSTKTSVCQLAAKHFRSPARFVGGHPLAGKEVSGIENADPDLFRGAKYALIGRADDLGADPLLAKFASLICVFGAEIAWCDAETHDWAVGIVSHLPQLTSIALARVVLDELDETGLPVSLAGAGLRDMLRLAGSPYSLWRDICFTNTENISRSLDRLSQAIDQLRAILRSRELEDEFQSANELYKILHNLQ